MEEYRCTERCFWHNGLRDPGTIVLADRDEMADNPCFVPVNVSKPAHIEPKKDDKAAEPKPQPKKGTRK